MGLNVRVRQSVQIGGRLAAGTGLEVSNYCQHSSMSGAVVVQAKFRKDRTHVSLHSSLREPERTSDDRVGVALCRLPEYFHPTHGEVVETRRCRSRANEGSDHCRVEGRTAVGHAAHSIRKFVKVENAVREEIPDLGVLPIRSRQCRNWMC